MGRGISSPYKPFPILSPCLDLRCCWLPAGCWNFFWAHWSSGSKFDAESDFEVRLAVAPPKSIKHVTKLIFETLKFPIFTFLFFGFWYRQALFKVEIWTARISARLKNLQN